MKKLIYISAISFLLLSLASCYTNKTLTSQEEYNSCMKKKDGQYILNEDYLVLTVVTKQKDTILFNINSPGRVLKTGVSGFPQVRLVFNDAIDSIIFTQQSVQYKTIKYIWKKGERFDFIKQDSLGYVCHLADTVNIPFSNIDQIQVKKDIHKTIGWTLIGVGIASVTAIIIILIYSFSLLP